MIHDSLMVIARFFALDRRRGRCSTVDKVRDEAEEDEDDDDDDDDDAVVDSADSAPSCRSVDMVGCGDPVVGDPARGERPADTDDRRLITDSLRALACRTTAISDDVTGFDRKPFMVASVHRSLSSCIELAVMAHTNSSGMVDSGCSC